MSQVKGQKFLKNCKEMLVTTKTETKFQKHTRPQEKGERCPQEPERVLGQECGRGRSQGSVFHRNERPDRLSIGRESREHSCGFGSGTSTRHRGSVLSHPLLG